MQLALSTWQEIEQYLKRSTGIIIPIGSTEQHGPNGLIGTDTICPVRILGDLCRYTGRSSAFPALQAGQLVAQ